MKSPPPAIDSIVFPSKLFFGPCTPSSFTSTCPRCSVQSMTASHDHNVSQYTTQDKPGTMIRWSTHRSRLFLKHEKPSTCYRFYRVSLQVILWPLYSFKFHINLSPLFSAIHDSVS
eukprot:TRINITY_DN1239_c0_g1_i1.p1 TRINITY_DN1239_c0_g1~~TRINITY_DN1239_c0_g1_i1.p1  ORF type:complete len:116 (+),score=3.92 TRINITY_DN1239_c0_g1_i1:281-628(+)